MKGKRKALKEVEAEFAARMRAARKLPPPTLDQVRRQFEASARTRKKYDATHIPLLGRSGTYCGMGLPGPVCSIEWVKVTCQECYELAKGWRREEKLAPTDVGGYESLKARPHPGPLPQGEGGAQRRPLKVDPQGRVHLKRPDGVKTYCGLDAGRVAWSYSDSEITCPTCFKNF